MKQLSVIDNDTKEKKRSDVIWKLYIDGASRGNPGPSGAGVWLTKDDHDVIRDGFYLGRMTNNQAEYHALLLGLFCLQQSMHADDKLHIFSDSQLLVRQIEGRYRVRTAHIISLHAKAMDFLRHHQFSITHLMRADNTVADLLANIGIDQKKVVPAGFNCVTK